METEVRWPIVVGYDGSASADLALRWAVDESLRTGAPVRLVHVLTSPVDPAAWQIKLIEPATRLVERARAEAQDRDPLLSLTAEVLVGDPATTLCGLSAASRLLVVGSRGHGGFTGMLTGSVSTAVATHAGGSVVLVRQLPQDQSLPVVAGFDESSRALSAVEHAFAEAAVRSVDLVVVHAWYPPLPGPYAAERLRAEEVAEIESAERRVMHDLVDPIAEKRPEVAVRMRLVAGSAGAALTQAAKQAQLVVVGNRGRGGFTGLLLGSTGLHLMHHADCPVMIVREIAASSAGT